MGYHPSQLGEQEDPGMEKIKINLIYLLTNQIQLSIFNYVIETNHTNKGVHHG
jgi:hypothetical protein